MLENCRETFYFKLIFKIFLGLCFFGLLVSFFMPYLFQFVPIYKQDECITFIIEKIDPKKSIYKYNLTIN